jgi:probable HAF family extracellular repeat protein
VLKEGVFTPIDVPANLGGFGPTFGTRCRGINDSGQIVGVYFDPAFHRHGFLFRDGAFSTFDFPGAPLTLPRSINNSGQIVGSYLLADRLLHGFLLAGGSFTPIDVPGARETDAADINNAGEIVGAYRDANNHVHAFRLAGGVFTTVRLPGVTQNSNGPVLFDLNDYVGIFGINDWGAITGTFLGRDGNFHGFIGVPRHEGGGEGGD